MLSIHNRITSRVLIAATLVMIFAGAGCDLRRSAVLEGDIPNDTTEDTGTGGTDAPDITWKTYESPTLGLRVPYPEGWYVEETARGTSHVVAIGSQPIAQINPSSDFVADVIITSSIVEKDAIIAGYGDEMDRSLVRLAGKEMTRLEYETELGAPDGQTLSRVALIWSDGGETFIVQGAALDNVVTEVATALITQTNGR
ncbi:MAG: hypothetical protein Q7S96_01660 [bacterium]|nr:hypothetical protein [bacterium]